MARAVDEAAGRTAAGTAAGAAYKDAARTALGRHLDELIALSEAIHADPELAFAEVRSAERVGGFLADAGLQVEQGICGLPTALRARAGSGPVQVVVCAEYAGLTVTVLGTPAEEGGGGKVLLLRHGAFDGAHAAMMVHPWPEDRLGATCLAVDHLAVRYTGREAHASAAPERGINAADAFVVAQVAIGLLRQHLEPGDQVHGIVEHGGEAPNVVPREATGRWMVRARTLERLATLRPRIERCFEAGALATGATMHLEALSPTYSHFEVDEVLLGAWRRNAEALGRRYLLADQGVAMPTISTDMANVSLALPSIHPLLGIDARGAVNHQPEFAAACVGPSAESD